MKDPAALLYIDVWKSATTEMSAIERAYYMDLILHQYDKGSLPNDVEELANICRVRFSEFDKFKQVFKQVLEQKFELNSNNRLENQFAKEIIRKRERFLDKRSNSGKISYLVKYAREHFALKPKDEKVFKDHLDVNNIDTKNEQVFKQVLEQIFELYINVNEDENINKDINKDNSSIVARKREFKKKVYSFQKKYPVDMLDKFYDYWTEKNTSGKKMRKEMQPTFEVSKRLASWASRNKEFKAGKSTKATDTRSTGYVHEYTKPTEEM